MTQSMRIDNPVLDIAISINDQFKFNEIIL